MTDDPRSRRAEALFLEALELPHEARTAWISWASGGDEDLARAVHELLDAHDQPGGVLDRGLGSLSARSLEFDRPPRPLGPYRIMEEVGRGGMSVVYRAERSDGHFRRQVALKVLRGELDGEELHVRLTAERQILASLDHPNIARLLDGGVTEEGRPYLVMEYVEGRPLTEYCRRADLSVEARLELFLEVARAVQHAHARLVVHRDLKPSNILVTDKGEVRLLDFGIAKVLEERSVQLDRPPVTRQGSRMFTPEYASPEQLRGEPASVANDVWALGVVLYELLTGVRPFLGLEGEPGDMEREILKEDPVRPSLRARALGSPALARRLTGDLDRIVSMALRKEPARRYASAEQLAEDLERHLSHLPVRAQPDRLGYRARKFLLRNRVQSAAAVLVLLSVVTGAGMAAWQAREARIERDRAEAGAQRANALADYLLDLFRVADPWEVPADHLSARQLLVRGESRLAELPDDPPLRARVLLALGATYRSLEDLSAARPLLEEAVAIRRREYGELDPRTGEALRALAELLSREGHLTEAEVAARAALAASRGGRAPGAGVDPRGEAAGLDLLGFIHTGMGRTEDALGDFLTELDLLAAHGLADSPEFGHALVNVAAIHRRRGRFAQAEGLLREALAHRERTLGPEHPLTAVAMARLGGLLVEHLERPAEAAEWFVRALEIQDRVLGVDHPSRVEALGGLALIREQEGDVAGAEALLRESLRTHSAGLGAGHPLALAAAEGFAQFLARTGRLEAADSIFSRTLPARREALGSSHPGLAGSLDGWGRIQLQAGRLDEAEEAFLEALRIREEVFGDEHALVALVLLDLALVHEARGDVSAREAALQRALAIMEAFHPPGHPELLAVRKLAGMDEA
jgi:eukaryotic-like serine/threonine-protein kinase